MKRRYKPNVFRDIYEQPYSDVGVTRMKLYKSSKNSLGMVQRLDLLKRLPVHNGCVNSISWNETGDYILSGSDDQHIVITHGFNHKVLTKFKTSHRANIFSAKFLPGQGDRHIVSCSGDGIILFTDLNRPQSASPNQFSCHLGTTYDVVTVPNDSHSFLSCGEDGTVRWFDLRVKDKCRKGSCKDDILITCERAVTSLSLNPTAPYQLAVGCSDSRVRLFDRRMLGTVAGGYVETARSCRPLCTFTVPALKERSCRITSLNFSPDGEEILVSFSSDLLYLFSMRDSSGGDDQAAATEDDSDTDGPSSERSPAPVRRLRLRGDWSDTGPHARPERDGGAGGAGEFVQTRRTLHSSLMQRMTDVLSRMLNDPATRANLNGGRGSQNPRPPEDESEDAGLAEQRPESPRSPVFPFEHPLNDSFSVNPFLPLDSPLSPDPEHTPASPDPEPTPASPVSPGDAHDVRATADVDEPDSRDFAADRTPASPMSLDETPVGDTPTGGYCPVALGNAARPSSPSMPCTCDGQTLLSATTTTVDDLPRPDQSMPSNSLDVAQSSENGIAQCSENGLDIVRHSENSLDNPQCSENSSDIVQHSENSLDVAECSENSLDIVQRSENGLDVAQCSENGIARCSENSSDIARHSENGSDIAQQSVRRRSETPSADVDPSHSLAGTKALEQDHHLEDTPAATTVNMSIELVTCREEATEGEGEEPPPRFTIGDPGAKMQLVDPSLDDNFRRDSPMSPPPPTATESVATQATGRTIEVREEDEVGEEEVEEDSEDSADADAQQFPRVMYPRPRRVMIPPGDIAQLRSNEDLIDTLHSMRHRHANEPAVLLSVSDVTETGAAFAVRLAAETERGPPDIPFLPQHRASRDELERGLRGRSSAEEDENVPSADVETGEEEDSTPRHRTIHPIEREMDEAIAGARRSSGLASEEERPTSSSFQPTVRRVFSGHRNARTMIKEACFWGSDYVMSGSDCGHVFVWERTTGRLVQLLEGDDHVVNCLQPHPTLPLLATSGIDYDVKLWAPLAVDTTFDTALADMLKKRNEIMLEETKDTITVPATFMIRMLACLNQIRRGGRRNRRTDDESNE